MAMAMATHTNQALEYSLQAASYRLKPELPPEDLVLTLVGIWKPTDPVINPAR